MILEAILVTWSLGHAQPPSVAPASQESACAQALAGRADAATVEICSAEEQVRRASAEPEDSTQRRRLLAGAVSHYRRAANLASDTETEVLALDGLADLYGDAWLNDLGQQEGVLRELIGLQPHPGNNRPSARGGGPG